MTNEQEDAILEQERQERRRTYNRIRYAQRIGRPVRERTNVQRHGITKRKYRTMLDEQNHLCAICASPSGLGTKKSRELSVDHCHQTGQVRGLLCTRCNVGLGYFQDNPMNLRRAIDYLLRIK